MRPDIKKLSSFPRNRLLADDLIRARVSELELLAAFGEPTNEEQDDGDEPTFYWDLEWPCELVMGLRFRQLSEILTVKLDGPDFVHALRHLDLDFVEVSTIESFNPVRYKQLVMPSTFSWELWRDDEHGTMECIGIGLTERDAECQRASLETPGQKKSYWVNQSI